MIYKTSNFYLAAAFLSCGIQMVDIDQGDKRHLKFCFDGDQWKAIETKWDTNSLMVNARSYAEAIRDIKLKIHQITGE